MTITYIFHSAFAIEAEHAVLIFDYWMDPAHIVPSILQTNKPVYVFSSHFHEDHFSREIFSWRNENCKITYILSKDILKRRRAEQKDADVWMAKGAVWQDENIKVTATGSNDSGVSWIVELDGKTLFHAGDLNNWYARFLSDREDVPPMIISDDYEAINPLKEEKRYLGELKDIAKITTRFDLVMFPVDGRIGNGYTLGARQFLEQFSVGYLVPMHFIVSGFESAWRMEEFCLQRKVPFWCITKEGEKLTF